MLQRRPSGKGLTNQGATGHWRQEGHRTRSLARLPKGGMRRIMSPSWLKKTTSASQGHDCSSRLDRLIKRTAREQEPDDKPSPVTIDSSSTSLVRREFRHPQLVGSAVDNTSAHQAGRRDACVESHCDRDDGSPSNTATGGGFRADEDNPVSRSCLRRNWPVMTSARSVIEIAADDAHRPLRHPRREAHRLPSAFGATPGDLAHSGGRLFRCFHLLIKPCASGARTVSSR